MFFGRNAFTAFLFAGNRTNPVLANHTNYTLVAGKVVMQIISLLGFEQFCMVFLSPESSLPLAWVHGVLGLVEE